MENILIRLLFITSSCSFSEKHIFIQNPLPWLDAQQYCREHHTNLSPLTNELEEKVFRESVNGSEFGWIGLYWNSTEALWRWSEEIDSKADNRLSGFSVAVRWSSDTWIWTQGHLRERFFCLNLILVQEEKTWEEALEHCRETRSNLTSLLSETENLLAQTEIQHGDITERVWIGLRYLEDSWLWVNGHPLEYEAWNQGGDQCPIWRGCGALNKEGTWENRDCRERLNFICA